MHTIIINTMDSELRQDPLFFLPFRKDQLSWLDWNLNDLGGCTEAVSSILGNLFEIQDYHLVVLVSLEGYQDADSPRILPVYQELLRAYINHQLLVPLCREQELPPRSANIVFVLDKMSTRNSPAIQGQELDHVLGLTADAPIPRPLRITRVNSNGHSESLDLDPIFAISLEANESVMATRKAELEVSVNDFTLSKLRKDLLMDIEEWQDCDYVPIGRKEQSRLKLTSREFSPQTTNHEIFLTDLQINISEFLANQILVSPDYELELVSHTGEEIAARIRRAKLRVSTLLASREGKAYYSLETQSRGTPSGSLSGSIWALLEKNQKDVPGVQDALDHVNSNSESDELTKDPLSVLRRAWFLVSAEKKQFDELCAQLDEEYNEETAKKQQSALMDTCVQAFSEERRRVLRLGHKLPDKPTLDEMPVFDVREEEKKLAQTQQECSRVTLESLADYTDVRQEAEVIKAKFRRAYRFWAPDADNMNTRYFQTYSTVLVVLFLLQMILPYLGITLGQSGVDISRYVHFLLSIAVFAALYFIGLLAWLFTLCKELNHYSVEMFLLIQKSCRKRRDSIEAVVNAYGSMLPACTVLYEDLQEKKAIHAMNLELRDCYTSHMDLLSGASVMLDELRTRLRLYSSYSDDSAPLIQGGLRYRLPPSHPVNIPYYMIFSDNWGG